jgi:hypothetical protein
VTSAIARWIAIGCALVAASAFALSVWVGQWWSIATPHLPSEVLHGPAEPDLSIADVTVGPLGSYACFGGECRARGLGWLGASARWERTAFASAATGLFAMALLVVLAAGLAAKRKATIVARTALVSVATALACGSYLVATFPGMPGARLGIGVLLFALAVVLGGGAAVMALRSGRA